MNHWSINAKQREVLVDLVRVAAQEAGLDADELALLAPLGIEPDPDSDGDPCFEIRDVLNPDD